MAAANLGSAVATWVDPAATALIDIGHGAPRSFCYAHIERLSDAFARGLLRCGRRCVRCEGQSGHDRPRQLLDVERLIPSTRLRRAHQPHPAVEDRQHLVRLCRWQRDHDARDADVAVVTQPIHFLHDAEHGDRQ
jgi:hypothetical protein